MTSCLRYLRPAFLCDGLRPPTVSQEELPLAYVVIIRNLVAAVEDLCGSQHTQHESGKIPHLPCPWLQSWLADVSCKVIGFPATPSRHVGGAMGTLLWSSQALCYPRLKFWWTVKAAVLI